MKIIKNYFCTFASEMKRFTLLYLFMVCLVAALSGQNKHEVRAVWLTTIGGIDWPRSYAHDGMGIRQQQEQLCHILG